MTPSEFLVDLYAQQHFYTSPESKLKYIESTFRDGRKSLDNIELPARAGTWKKMDRDQKRRYLDLARKELEGLGVKFDEA
jgi:hypothetical protein